MLNKTIDDVMVCPDCDSTNCYEYSNNEIDFTSGNEHYSANCHCVNCGKDFKLNFNFEYNITKLWIG